MFRNNLAILKKQLELKNQLYIVPAVVNDNDKEIIMSDIIYFFS